MAWSDIGQWAGGGVVGSAVLAFFYNMFKSKNTYSSKFIESLLKEHATQAVRINMLYDEIEKMQREQVATNRRLARAEALLVGHNIPFEVS